MSGTAKTAGSAAAAEVKPKVDLGLLEEDDEFEEFPTDSWTGKAEEEDDIKVWEDNWDDDNVEDDFSLQLRAELDKQPGAAAVKTEPAQKK